jgi:glutamine cyclotransferase
MLNRIDDMAKMIIIISLALTISCAEQKNLNSQIKSADKSETKSDLVANPINELSYTILRELPHDTEAFTQGLYYLKGFLYESTGQYRKSSLRKIDAGTGNILKMEKVDNSYFAEGLTIFKNKIYQLTWISNTGFIYDLSTMNQTGTFHYYGEGWGITNDENSLIISDGTNGLRFLNPRTFVLENTIFVTDQNSNPVSNLNELEMIDGYIWANVWMQNYIVRIDATSGKVVSRLDLSELRNKITITPETDVLNGIAYDKVKDEFYVTGKNWNKIFVIKVN